MKRMALKAVSTYLGVAAQTESIGLTPLSNDQRPR